MAVWAWWHDGLLNDLRTLFPGGLFAEFGLTT